MSVMSGSSSFVGPLGRVSEPPGTTWGWGCGGYLEGDISIIAQTPCATSGKFSSQCSNREVFSPEQTPVPQLMHIFQDRFSSLSLRLFWGSQIASRMIEPLDRKSKCSSLENGGPASLPPEGVTVTAPGNRQPGVPEVSWKVGSAEGQPLQRFRVGASLKSPGLLWAFLVVPCVRMDSKEGEIKLPVAPAALVKLQLPGPSRKGLTAWLSAQWGLCEMAFGDRSCGGSFMAPKPCGSLMGRLQEEDQMQGRSRVQLQWEGWDASLGGREHHGACETGVMVGPLKHT